ncbi:caspase family protein [Actinacidiphila glaucinigra]|uniref:caspase family protein n=1 Tax=Actinacidiphila glaucinigra TaxID=235986 RepID=UPI002DD97335|nr:caspase family protein [Actinacidiphila glaucinigra]WSD57533.1 caspase family protein [Actinacidiphila glaucinigra]WSD65112.1 caspase family protein [Actinacidiphila glaucinigra]
MARHRALLIGASAYEMRGVPPLPFVPGDLARLGSVLEDRGFDVLVVAGREDGKQVSRNFVDGQVAGFLRRAGRDDTLLILLSGHGVHAAGRDFLVPEDIHEDTHPFESGCVAIDWRAHLDQTPAGRIVFLIDACREGIEQESMGVASVRQWGRQKVSAALRRKVAYVYACSAGQFALFVRSRDKLVDAVADVRSGESFSIFSRSVSDVIAAHTGAVSLGIEEFQRSVQDRITELHRAYRKAGQPQALRIVTDIPTDDFSFLPPPRAATMRSGRSPEPSAVDSDADATPDMSTAMAALSGTPRSAPIARRFRPTGRALSALATLGVLGVTAWAIATHHGNTDDRGGAPDKTGSSTSATPGSSSPKTSRATGKGSDSGKGLPLGTSLPACTANAVELTVRSPHDAYTRTERPTVEITAKNSSDSSCKVDFAPQTAVVTITPADRGVPYWSSADCPKTAGSYLLQVPAHGITTYTVHWNRKPSSPTCTTPPVGTAEPGTYLVELTASRFGKA